MNPSDITSILQWEIIFFIIGIFFLPLTTKIFSSFTDYGYIFSKIIGIALISYIVFFLGITHIIPFTKTNILLVIVFLAVINFILDKGNVVSVCSKKWHIFLLEEFIFLAALIFWSYIRSHQPDIHGLEKYMDFGFINSILRSDYFPPRDMWFTPLPINYYYFGHLVTAVLTKLSSMPSFITYNLMLATLFAFTFTASFSLAINLIYSKTKDRLEIRNLLAGLLTAFLVTFAGNLHTIYTYFKPYEVDNPVPFWQLPFLPSAFPNSYWYPNATRFIENTIHEFPIYSFVVSDLHGHVIDIPFVLLTIAILLSLILNFLASRRSGQFPIFNQINNHKNSKRFENLNFRHWNLFRISNLDIRILLLGFILAVMYMTNAWDGIIYFLLTSIIVLIINIRAGKPNIPNTIYSILIILLGFILFSLPFSLNFKPFVSGIGLLCMPQFLTNIGKLGPFLFEPDHCQKSPIWQLFILYGFFYFWIIFYFIKNLDFNP